MLVRVRPAGSVKMAFTQLKCFTVTKRPPPTISILAVANGPIHSLRRIFGTPLQAEPKTTMLGSWRHSNFAIRFDSCCPSEEPDNRFRGAGCRAVHVTRLPGGPRRVAASARGMAEFHVALW